MPVTDDIDLMMTMVASGIVDAHETVQRKGALPVPYPVNLQRALDRTTAVALVTGTPAPAGVSDLLRWCAAPLGHHFPVNTGDMHDEVFLEGGVPTRAAREWALNAHNAEAERVENRVIGMVRRKASDSGNQHLYVAFRQLIIEEPVLSSTDFAKKQMDPVLGLVADAITESYTEAGPEYLTEDDTVVCCADCGHLLAFNASEAKCRNDRCSRTGAARLGRWLDATESVMHLKDGIRMSISTPGVAEMRLYRALTTAKYREAGLTVHLWPSCDAYDLGIVFPSGTVWAVDVKDWSNPVRLASQVTAIKAAPVVPDGCPWSKAYLVPSSDCCRQQPHYLNTLRQRLKQRIPALNFEAISERTLVKRVKDALSGEASRA